MRYLAPALLASVLLFGCDKPKHKKDDGNSSAAVEQERPKREADQPGWHYHHFVDKMTDESAFKALSFDGRGNMIQIGCDNAGHNTIVYFSLITKTYEGEGSRFLEWRVDQKKSQLVLADYDKDSASLLDKDKATSLIDDMKNAHTVLFRSHTFDNDEVEASFVIDGTSAMVERLNADCIK